MHTVVLVEGLSDRAAVETLARRLGRDLDAEGVGIRAMGGGTSIGRGVVEHGPQGAGRRLTGLVDRREAGSVARALHRAGLLAEPAVERLAPAGFFVCGEDLEDELVRALGVPAVLEVVERAGETGLWRTFCSQPAHRDRDDASRLRRFLGTRAGRKIRYGTLLVEALPLGAVPRPLADLLDTVGPLPGG
ncbi:ATP-dependent endonuclease [Desertihabitans brevis]|uniref:ATP-dependent endonuclease n=1 Tax=Desertihabitans brevis TaxID=2268447 RepID=A0A367YRT0_9ACTN|nr:ATP-dependent endonuclease [Desertihabitans brevis]